MTVPDHIEIRPGVIAEGLPLGETLLMNVHTLAYFGLDALGTRFWRALQVTGDPAEVVRAVARETGQDASELAVRLNAFLDGLERSGLIERGRPEGRPRGLSAKPSSG